MMASNSDSESKDDYKQSGSDGDEDDDENSTIIIDNGGGYIRSGFSTLNENGPQSIQPSVIGHAKSTEIHRDTFIGKEAILKHQTLHNVSLNRPIEHGLIRDWEDMTTFWRFIFDKELHAMDDLEYSGLVLSETPLNPRLNREKAAQIVFETFQFASYYTQSSAVLELYSHGQTTGMVIGVGYDSAYTAPVFQGYSLAHATRKMDVGGNSVSKQLRKLLNAKGYDIDHMTNDIEVIEDIKKRKCFVANDYAVELQNKDSPLWKNINVLKYGLPDGNELTLASDRFECTEILFKPHLMGGHKAQKYKSICGMAYESLLSLNIDLRLEIVSQLCICGGGSLLNGFSERFTKDLKATVPHSMRLGIHSKKNRHNAAYIGASILSSLDFFKECSITTAEYEETGPKIVHRKCF